MALAACGRFKVSIDIVLDDFSSLLFWNCGSSSWVVVFVLDRVQCSNNTCLEEEEEEDDDDDTRVVSSLVSLDDVLQFLCVVVTYRTQFRCGGCDT